MSPLHVNVKGAALMCGYVRMVHSYQAHFVCSSIYVNQIIRNNCMIQSLWSTKYRRVHSLHVHSCAFMHLSAKGLLCYRGPLPAAAATYDKFITMCVLDALCTWPLDVLHVYRWGDWRLQLL